MNDIFEASLVNQVLFFASTFSVQDLREAD